MLHGSCPVVVCFSIHVSVVSMILLLLVPSSHVAPVATAPRCALGSASGPFTSASPIAAQQLGNNGKARRVRPIRPPSLRIPNLLIVTQPLVGHYALI